MTPLARKLGSSFFLSFFLALQFTGPKKAIFTEGFRNRITNPTYWRKKLLDVAMTKRKPQSSQRQLSLSSTPSPVGGMALDGTATNQVNELPTMIVFDLDDCLWTPEMYTLPSKPSIPILGDLGLGNGEQGVVGIKCAPAGPTIRLFDGARQALKELATNPIYKDVTLGAASSSEEPTYSHACLEHLEILPGLTLRKMFKYDQIGRTGQLTPRKTTHFALLHEESRIPYEEMLFFDDCNWGDHVGDVKRTLGVEGQRTPGGLQYPEFVQGLETYRKAYNARTSPSGS